VDDNMCNEHLLKFKIGITIITENIKWR
jgi:hypothetical protein